MGFPPSEAKKMSVFEYLAALDGFAEANNPEAAGKLSDAEKDELWEFINGR